MRDLAGGIQAPLPGHNVRTCPKAKVAESAADIEVLLPARAVINRVVLKTAHNLRLVQQPGLGIDKIDVVDNARRLVADEPLLWVVK
jgi:lactate dehydrogenase-like 2-hydroxyacid dehydrogenase